MTNKHLEKMNTTASVEGKLRRCLGLFFALTNPIAAIESFKLCAGIILTKIKT